MLSNPALPMKDIALLYAKCHKRYAYPLLCAKGGIKAITSFLEKFWGLHEERPLPSNTIHTPHYR